MHPKSKHLKTPATLSPPAVVANCGKQLRNLDNTLLQLAKKKVKLKEFIDEATKEMQEIGEQATKVIRSKVQVEKEMGEAAAQVCKAEPAQQATPSNSPLAPPPSM